MDLPKLGGTLGLGMFAPGAKPVGRLGMLLLGRGGTLTPGADGPTLVFGFTLVGIWEDLALFCRDWLDSAPAGVGRPQTKIAMDKKAIGNGYFFITHLLHRPHASGGPSVCTNGSRSISIKKAKLLLFRGNSASSSALLAPPQQDSFTAFDSTESLKQSGVLKRTYTPNVNGASNFSSYYYPG
jgi:hypothetical protein